MQMDNKHSQQILLHTTTTSGATLLTMARPWPAPTSRPGPPPRGAPPRLDGYPCSSKFL